MKYKTKKIINKILIVTLAISLIGPLTTLPVHAKNVDKNETKVEQKAEDNKKEETSKEVKEVQEKMDQRETQNVYPILVVYNGSSSVDYLTEDELNTIYKVIADNIDSTYLTTDSDDIISFDQSTNYKITKELKKKLEKMFAEENLKNMKDEDKSKDNKNEENKEKDVHKIMENTQKLFNIVKETKKSDDFSVMSACIFIIAAISFLIFKISKLDKSK